MQKNTETSWGGVADWYDAMLHDEKSFQKNVIAPNLLRLMEIKRGERLLDLACGTGYFSNIFFDAGALVSAVDIGRELIEIARSNSDKHIEYTVASADKIPHVKSESMDKVAIVLALQNIENVSGVLAECKRVLKKNGSLYLVLNHPTFRIPGTSEWGYDEAKNIEYRRIDAYLSEKKVSIDMHPGEKKKDKTISFHRSLQYYFKQFAKQGFCVARLEEWISHRHGPKGKRYAATENSRKEIPLFLFLEIKKLF